MGGMIFHCAKTVTVMKSLRFDVEIYHFKGPVKEDISSQLLISARTRRMIYCCLIFAKIKKGIIAKSTGGVSSGCQIGSFVRLPQ